MSIARQKELINDSGDLGEQIPGLNVNSVVENLAKKSAEVKTQIEIIEVEINENVERGMPREQAKEEAKEKRKELIEKYKESISEIVPEQIAIIKQQFKVVKEGLKRIPDDVKAAIANIALPPAVSAPPSAPNPVYAFNLVKTTKNALLGTLAVMIVAFTSMLLAANKISFVFPTSILSLFESIKTMSGLINGIPA